MRRVQFFLTRAVWLLSGVAMLLLVFSQGLLIYSAWSYVARIKPVQKHMDYMMMIEITDQELRSRLLELVSSPEGYMDPGEIKVQGEQLHELSQSRSSLAQTTPRTLAHALRQLNEFRGSDGDLISQTLYAMRAALNQELIAHQTIISSIQTDAERRLRIAIGLAFGFLVISVLLWMMVKQRIVTPLNNLSDQMTHLARRDYTELEIEDADPMLSPIIEKYNYMAQRLKTLEVAQQQRQDTLATEVRNASYMLLQQQHRLSQAERLGAVGEMAAGIAHELRNPLAGVQMALDNLRVDIQEQELVERLDMITNEVRRVNQQLNTLLGQARQRPEIPVNVNLDEELKALISLISYQLSGRIKIDYAVDKQLTCRLPRNRLHQALLNLVLNAGQVLEGRKGEILVHISEKDHMLEIKVMDNGPGFPETMLQTGIQPFHSARPGGTGLGLVMVRRIARDLGGEVTLSNRQQGGACATLLLPCIKDG